MKWPWKREERNASTDPSWDNMRALLPDGALSGAHVTVEAAEGLSTVFACVQAIAETVASLPLLVYRRSDDGGRTRAPDHALYSILHDAPNPMQTALEFREQMQAAVLLQGNAYARIDWNRDGTVHGLHPIDPGSVTVVKLSNGRPAYDVSTDKGTERLLAEEVLHLKDRSDNGMVGRSRITVAREALGLALAQHDHGTYTYRNGAKVAGVLKFPGALTSEQVTRLRATWGRNHSGVENRHKVMIMEGGMEFQPVSMTMEDSEWLASMQFSVEQICRIFRVPPTMVGDLRHGNYSNTSELARHFVTHTLRRHLVMWEQACTRALLGPIGRGRYLIEHNVEGLLRGDSGNRADFYQSGIQAGWLLRSEARRLENLPAIEGIDNEAV